MSIQWPWPRSQPPEAGGAVDVLLCIDMYFRVLSREPPDA